MAWMRKITLVLTGLVIIGTVFYFLNFQDVKASITQRIELVDMKELKRNLQTAKTSAEVTEPKIIKPKKDKIAVICYIPRSVDEVHLFISLLFGSWKYITDNYQLFEERHNLSNEVDLLVFTHPKITNDVKTVCKDYSLRGSLSSNNLKQTCYVIEQPFEINIGYGPINSFVMFNRTDIYDILKPYKYTIRTDYDVFLSPTLFMFKPKHAIMSGGGGYSVGFNMKRMKEIAKKLNLNHNGVHNVGSTWFGETALFIKLSKMTLKMTAYMYLNEFKPDLPGLEKLEMHKNIHGEWPTWWRPVSLLYGAELSLNHLVKDFSVGHKGEMDTSSCSKEPIWKTPHIHCWHNDCEFQKFKFIKHLGNIIRGKETIPGEIAHRLIANGYDRDIRDMSITEYCTFIAWNSVRKHLEKWFADKKLKKFSVIDNKV